jgi:hypothetical protein
VSAGKGLVVDKLQNYVRASHAGTLNNLEQIPYTFFLFCSYFKHNGVCMLHKVFYSFHFHMLCSFLAMRRTSILAGDSP